jgi:serine phosphatase RsbU (regulator of sigma subunit)
VPVVPTFFRLVKQGLAIESIARHLNQELMTVLPVDHFLCVCLASLDQASGHFRIWNAGMPAVLFLDALGRPKARFESNHIPLGIEPWDSGMAATAGVDSEPGDSLLLFSDGVIEALNTSGDPFGVERLLWAVGEANGQDQVTAVRQALTRHIDSVPQADDISVVCFTRRA